METPVAGVYVRATQPGIPDLQHQSSTQLPDVFVCHYKYLEGRDVVRNLGRTAEVYMCVSPKAC